MIESQLLLLDESTVGLSPAYVEDITGRVIAISESVVEVLNVEQNARLTRKCRRQE